MPNSLREYSATEIYVAKLGDKSLEAMHKCLWDAKFNGIAMDEANELLLALSVEMSKRGCGSRGTKTNAIGVPILDDKQRNSNLP